MDFDAVKLANRLHAALDFYADPSTYSFDGTGDINSRKILIDALAVLKQWADCSCNACSTCIGNLSTIRYAIENELKTPIEKDRGAKARAVL